MNNQKQGWLVFVAANIINLCLGSVYAWSIFAAQFKKENPDWTMAEISTILSITVFTYAITSIAAGSIQDRIGPRWVATIGGLLMGSGIIMASQADSLIGLYFWHGIIAGIGIGAAYVTPLAAVLKWFPDRRGSVGGIVMGIFGAGGLVFGFLGGYIIKITGSISDTLLVLGLVYLVAVTLSAQFLNDPPKEKFRNDNSIYLAEEKNYSPGEVLRQPVFYVMWIVFVLGSISGLTFMSNAQEASQAFLGISTSAAVSIIGIVSIFNALGSPVFGTLADWIGERRALMVLLLICGFALFLLPRTSSYLTFVLAASIVILCYGGLFGIFPPMISNYYGSRHLGNNFGLLFFGYGIAAIVGPRMTASLGDSARQAAEAAGVGAEGLRIALSSGFAQAFVLAAIGCLIAAGLSLLIKKPYGE